jgi:hypothetical protein
VVKTIKVHRARVMHKMGARSLAHLVRLATAAGIVPEVAARADADRQNERPIAIETPKSLFSSPSGGSLL